MELFNSIGLLFLNQNKSWEAKGSIEQSPDLVTNSCDLCFPLSPAGWFESSSPLASNLPSLSKTFSHAPWISLDSF